MLPVQLMSSYERNLRSYENDRSNYIDGAGQQKLKLTTWVSIILMNWFLSRHHAKCVNLPPPRLIHLRGFQLGDWYSYKTELLDSRVRNMNRIWPLKVLNNLFDLQECCMHINEPHSLLHLFHSFRNVANHHALLFGQHRLHLRVHFRLVLRPSPPCARRGQIVREEVNTNEYHHATDAELHR